MDPTEFLLKGLHLLLEIRRYVRHEVKGNRSVNKSTETVGTRGQPPRTVNCSGDHLRTSWRARISTTGRKHNRLIQKSAAIRSDGPRTGCPPRRRRPAAAPSLPRR